MGYKIPVNEERRTIVMASGNRLELHNVTGFDNSGKFLRVWSDEGLAIVNEKNIDWLIAKNEPHMSDMEEPYEYSSDSTLVADEDIQEFLDNLFAQQEVDSEYSHMTDPDAIGPSPYSPYQEEEEVCECPVCQAFNNLQSEEDETTSSNEETTDLVSFMLSKAANASTAEEALMWTQTATNIENLNYMRSH